MSTIAPGASYARALGALSLVVLTLGAASPARADFGLSSFSAKFEDSSKQPLNVAGAHPNLTTILRLNESGGLPDGALKSIEVNFPAGFYGDTTVAPTCVVAEMVAREGYCAPAAQVGTIYVDFEPLPPGGTSMWDRDPLWEFPVYNTVSTSEQTTQLGAEVVTSPVKISISPRTDGDYGLTAKISSLNQGFPVYAAKLVLWGVPADPANDAHRLLGFGIGGAPAGFPPRPFLSLPARCEPVEVGIRVASWQHPGNWASAGDQAPALEGCDGLSFEPTLDGGPQAHSPSTPTGVGVDIRVPQDKSAKGQATPQLREARIRFPEGLALSPGSASGLGSCSDPQLALGTKAEPACPASSKLGSVTIDAPVLKGQLSGDLVLGTPRPGQLLRLFMVVRGPGILMKIPGTVQLDQRTGQLTASFEEMPQLPFEEIQIEFKGGPRAVFVTPGDCGTYVTHAELTSWASRAPVASDSSFTLDRRCEKRQKFTPAIEAGTVDSRGGSSSPFLFRLVTEDGQENVSGVEVTLPGGVLARLANVPLCAAADSCPDSSRVGTVTVGAGAGSSPLYMPQPGQPSTAVYLAGPYKGAPYSLVADVPAQAGPFDLGVIAVRSGLFVDPVSARTTIKSDPLPQILEGIPVSYRDIRLALDRPGFVVTPTSCDPLEVKSTIRSVGGALATPGSRFRATDCDRLGFRPKFAMRLSGPPHRSAHPKLRVSVKTRKGDANIGRMAFTLPPTEYLENAHITGVCTRAQFVASDCPADSVYGHAKAWTPLLARPLRGPVYLRESAHKLPDLVMALDGQISLDLAVRIDAAHGRIRNTLESVPDVPLSKLVLNMYGGKRGLLVNNTGLCQALPRAAVEFRAQNGRSRAAELVARADCGKRGAGKRASSR